MANARKKPGNKPSEYNKRTNETHLQWQSRIARMRQAERETGAPIVTPFAERHGSYVDEFIHHDESSTKAQAKRNLKASPLAMWRAQGMLEPHHEEAIKLCLRLWSFLPPMPATTAQYGERIPSNDSGHESEAAVNAWIDAKAHLKQVEGYFPGKLRAYWETFQNCIRFDQPAGVAGSDLGFTGRSGRAKAHVIVCLVADVIADKEDL